MDHNYCDKFEHFVTNRSRFRFRSRAFNELCPGVRARPVFKERRSASGAGAIGNRLRKRPGPVLRQPVLQQPVLQVRPRLAR